MNNRKGWLLLLCALPLAAQITTGEINGTVTLSNGSEAAPGVVITIESPALQGQRSAVSDATGKYRFPLLPIGNYSATFVLAGFQTKKITNISVSTSEKTKVNVALENSGVQEELVVTASETLIDTTTTDSKFVLDDEALSSIPSLARSIEDVAKFVPGVTGVRHDAVSGGEGGLPVIRGGGQEGNAYVVDGLSVRSSRGFDGSSVTQNFDSIRSLEIVSDPFSPEYGKSLGGALNVITKSGGDEFSGELGFHFRDDDLESDREPTVNPSAVTGFDRNKLWTNLGGYFIKEKLWFFASFNHNDFADVSSGADPRTIDASKIVNFDGSNATSDYTLFNYNDGEATRKTTRGFFKMTFNINQNQNVDLSYLRNDYSLDSLVGNPDLFAGREVDAERLRMNYNFIMDNGGFLELKAGHQKEHDVSGGLTNRGIATRNIIDEAWRYSNLTRFDDTTEQRTDFAAKYTGFFVTDSFGTHELVIGAEIENYKTDWYRNNTGFGEDVFNGDGFDQGTDFTFNIVSNDDGLYVLDQNGQIQLVPNALTERRNAADLNEVDGYGFYIQDRITINNVTVMLGLRTDQMKIYDDTGQEIWTWDTSDFLSPRLSVVYDLKGDQSHILKAAYGIFKDSSTTRIAEFFNRNGGNAFRDYTWHDPEHINPSEAELHDPNNWVFNHEQSSETTPFVYAEGLEPNKAERFLLEYNWQYSSNHAFTMRYSQNDQTDLIEDINIYQDDWYFFLLDNFEHKRRNFKGVDLQFNGRINNNWRYYVAYTWTDSKGTNPGQFENESFLNSGGSGNYVGIFGDAIVGDGSDTGNFLEGIFANLGGRGLGDQGWYGKLSDSVDNALVASFTGMLPLKIETTLQFQYVDGYFYTKKGFQDAYHGWFAFPEGRGSRQTDPTSWTDMTFMRNFTVGKVNLRGRLDIINAFDQQKPTGLVEEDISIFEEPVYRQDPRTFQLGIEVNF